MILPCQLLCSLNPYSVLDIVVIFLFVYKRGSMLTLFNYVRFTLPDRRLLFCFERTADGPREEQPL